MHILFWILTSSLWGEDIKLFDYYVEVKFKLDLVVLVKVDYVLICYPCTKLSYVYTIFFNYSNLLWY